MALYIRDEKCLTANTTAFLSCLNHIPSKKWYVSSYPSNIHADCEFYYKETL
jgi:hypothetical protein